MTLYTQAVAPRLGTQDGPGWCLRFTQAVFGAPVRYQSARTAWEGQQHRHPGEAPPRGVAVPIWLDHYGTYGTPPSYGNWGHTAVSLGDGRVLTSPMYQRQGGQAIYPSIEAMQRDLGGTPRYLGWSESMNGLRVATPTASTPIPEEDPMQYIALTGKSGSRRGGLYAVIGRKAIFIGSKIPDGIPTVSDETAIRELQGLIEGLR